MPVTFKIVQPTENSTKQLIKPPDGPRKGNFAWCWSRKLIYIHETWTRRPRACGCLGGHPQEFRSVVTRLHYCIVSMLGIVPCCISLHSWYWDEMPCRSEEDPGPLVVHRVKVLSEGTSSPEKMLMNQQKQDHSQRLFQKWEVEVCSPQWLVDKPVPPAPCSVSGSVGNPNPKWETVPSSNQPALLFN